MIKHWSPAELATLRQLRERFITGTAGAADYWKSRAELELYDATFAERIGWKWDAALAELVRRGWRPQSRRILDWGCGSGVAHRRVLELWPQFSTLAVHDRSPQALDYSVQKARQQFPGVQVSGTMPTVDGNTLLLVSHVINELSDAALERLLEAARGAGEVIWVEAGTFADSRRLIGVRERLLEGGQFVAVAPCTHQARCGMLDGKNAPHWCHHFSIAPSEIFQDARWAELGKEIGIDLGRVPYSFLVLARPQAAVPTPPGFSHVIGEPREATGYARVLSCQEEGVTEFMLQKRDAPDLFRAVRKGKLATVQRWELEKGRIAGGEPLASAESAE